MSDAVTDTFTFDCECGVIVKVAQGRIDAHECAPITAQQVRDAWAEGYAFAHRQWASGA